MLFALLALADTLLAAYRNTVPLAYLALMALIGTVLYAAMFLFLPIPALRGEAERWRRQAARALRLPSSLLPHPKRTDQ